MIPQVHNGIEDACLAHRAGGQVIQNWGLSVWSDIIWTGDRGLVIDR